jgi:hypothetical protein
VRVVQTQVSRRFGDSIGYGNAGGEDEWDAEDLVGGEREEGQFRNQDKTEADDQMMWTHV